MRKLLVLSACGAFVGLVALAFGQVRGLDLLRHFASKLNQAESLRANYTITPLGGAPVEYSIELVKPNRARLETQTTLLVADGQDLITLDKTTNKFYRERLQENGIKVIISQTPFTSMWLGFFDANAFGRTVNPIWVGEHQRKGMKLNGVKYTTGMENSNAAVLYFDKPDGVLRQGELDLVGPRNRTTYLLDTSAVEINAAIPEDRFSWRAPAGAKEVSKQELTGAWFTNLGEAIQAAKASKRLLFVDFYADW